MKKIILIIFILLLILYPVSQASTESLSVIFGDIGESIFKAGFMAGVYFCNKYKNAIDEETMTNARFVDDTSVEYWVLFCNQLTNKE